MNDDVPDRVRQLVATLHAARQTGYGDALPGPLEPVFAQLAIAYKGLDERGRVAVRAAIPDDLRLLLLGFSDRLATIAARTGSKPPLFEALLAHVLEDFRHDPRENVFRLSIIHHVAKQLGLHPGVLFRRAAALASPAAARHLEEFVARPEATKSLKTMRIREVRTPAGVAFEYLQ